MQNDPFIFSCKLPSEGRLYDIEIPEGIVKINPMRGEHEELLAATGNEQNAAIVMRDISRQLTELPDDLNFLDLLVTDWMAIVFQLMAVSYSPEITLHPQCPYCNDSAIRVINPRGMDIIPGLLRGIGADDAGSP